MANMRDCDRCGRYGGVRYNSKLGGYYHTACAHDATGDYDKAERYRERQELSLNDYYNAYLTSTYPNRFK